MGNLVGILSDEARMLRDKYESERRSRLEADAFITKVKTALGLQDWASEDLVLRTIEDMRHTTKR